MMRWLALLLALLASPAWADMYPDASNAAHPAVRTNLQIGHSYGTLWSSLGVVADGVTDNTAALNALPVGIPITADCAAGSFVRLDGQWMLKSNLDIQWQPGCRMVSYYNGTWAITQTTINTPLTNVTLDGITFSKDAYRDVQLIMFNYIDHFKLLNWSFLQPNAGGMSIRGSCQEIAYGRNFVTDQSLIGQRGIRHYGNIPKVIDQCNQIADVWVHHNHILSGDGAYQTCQPGSGANWVNVSSDDFLWENNVGKGNTFALIGLNNEPPYNAHTCSNIVYRNNIGTGTSRGILINSSGNAVSNVHYSNQIFDAKDVTTNSAAIEIRGDEVLGSPGNFSNIVIDNVSVINTNVQAVFVDMPDTGTLTGLSILNSRFEKPRNVHSGSGLFSPNVSIRGGSDVLMKNNVIYGVNSPGATTVGVGEDDNTDMGTVTRFNFLGNLIVNVPAVSTALRLRNVTGGAIQGNTVQRLAGAATVTGISLIASGQNSPPAAQPGSTGILVSDNVLHDLATPLTWTCNGGSTNLAVYNVGDAGHTCP